MRCRGGDTGGGVARKPDKHLSGSSKQSIETHTHNTTHTQTNQELRSGEREREREREITESKLKKTRMNFCSFDSETDTFSHSLSNSVFYKILFRSIC